MKNIDHVLYYYQQIRPYYAQQVNILELGAGTGQFEESRENREAKVWGIDLDERVKENTNVDVPIIASLENYEVPAEHFSLACSKFVFEHISDPIPVLNLAYKSLKPGGKLIIVTVNKWHYAAILSRILPEKIIEKFVNRDEEDIFPTLYRFNCPFSIGKIVEASDFGVSADVKIEMCERHLYTNFFITRWLSKCYSAIVNTSDLLANLRAGLIVEITKK